VFICCAWQPSTFKLVNTEFCLKISHSNRLAPTRMGVSCLTSIICSYKELHLKAISCLWISHATSITNWIVPCGKIPVPGIAHADWLSSWCCYLDVNSKLASTSGGGLSPYTVNLPLLTFILNIYSLYAVWSYVSSYKVSFRTEILSFYRQGCILNKGENWENVVDFSYVVSKGRVFYHAFGECFLTVLEYYYFWRKNYLNYAYLVSRQVT
jgi:hypothetical protein